MNRILLTRKRKIDATLSIIQIEKKKRRKKLKKMNVSLGWHASLKKKMERNVFERSSSSCELVILKVSTSLLL